MATEPRRGRNQQGFTLVEVLIAMVILAIGLLGLEALGIGAVRAVGRAQQQSGFAVIASDTLERTLDRVRRGDGPGDGTYPYVVRENDREDSVRIRIVNQPRSTSVEVTVIPDPRGGVLQRRDSLRVVGHVFR